MPRPQTTALPDSVLAFDRGGPVPTYRDLAARLEAVILTGELMPGDRLDDETSLSEQLGVSRPTMRRAIQELVGKGLLVRRRGIGTQVVRPRTMHRRFDLTSLWDDLAGEGKVPTTLVLGYEHIPASNEIARTLEVAPGDTVLHVRRLRYSDGVPIAILENVLPPAHADISREALENRGLYELLLRRGVTVHVGHQSITARAASAQEAQLLERAKGAPLLVMTRTAFDGGGSAVETGTHVYRPDLYSFEATVVRN